MHIQTSWSTFRSQLSELSSIEILRLMQGFDVCQVRLHGFSDASERAYGACVYVVCRHSNHNVGSTLVCSKSRVAPLKAISLPRLELCGALLLVKLMKKVAEAVKVDISERHYWTDSKIVLAWIGSPSRRWQTFVANRVSEIQDSSSPNEWRHVKSRDNPADMISRGSTPAQLNSSTLWWEGPNWLKTETDFSETESRGADLDGIPEERKVASMAIAIVSNTVVEFDKFSSYSKLLRVVVHVLRFISGLRKRANTDATEYISSVELREARNVIIRLVQAAAWNDEIRKLSDNQAINRNSKLIGLKPYIGKDKLVRVGGRLDRSSLDEDAKHPLIIPSEHYVTKLIVMEKHNKCFHAGPTATLAAVRSEFWPISGLSVVKKHLRNCVVCRKADPMPYQQLMGQLPEARMQVSRPFARVGVDYCGPLFVRDRVRRNSKQYKAYVAVYVCMATKAVHIELVDDMTTEAFIGSLKRFTARRGLPSDIYSDNGRNLVGAEREIQRILNDPQFKKRIPEHCSVESVNWHFIPARAPHFGGLWEAAVKTMKRHLKRTIGEASLTVSEMITVLTQIEAIMNSRPITPLSDDPRDLEALTPAHFLIGSSMAALPEHDLQEVPTSKLSRWQHFEQLRQRFWSRWSREYLSACQQRSKWKTLKRETIRAGQLVMLKEDEAMPYKWTMARVLETHPGVDGVVRAVTLRTAKGQYKRPIVKLAPVPCD
ncbi:PREDICTED: uncharacterized protein LOC105556896 [Vollenhovia emeryi]|uniref:uncharacterized protein LOC105556896 n=1 Tax=Vollenhovia emeryi TaxID=411798 RepID=UPI0005F556A7|nr:PREDICTED: uncharacterized protein LOC105556896 [Vollenhovia emeryi]